MEGLGEGLAALGFWLAVGVAVAATIVSGARKEQEKEREKQATLRALLEKGGENTPEVLAYLREKDAAEERRAHNAWIAMGGNMSPREVVGFVGAFMVMMLAMIGGLIALGELSQPPFLLPGAEPATRDPLVALAPVGVMFGVWAAGFVIAWLVWRLSRERKNGAPPDA
jgi:hypothetical protein